ncbi:Pca regulon regulatory protein [uncultured Alphaproteobacteria bacterium]|uniref:Pca regulon regulatory protein n=1 Tax=uncultured Alphaproteobacteria bacterium TaxID=91750 RepID=A0A212JJX9_9PROT|nr:Pca regulon regulatory protein [uncultured Alphaproteobacteria bacterium]
MIEPDSPDFVSSFARGLAVIRSFGAETPRQTLTEVAERTGMTRAAARRFLLTLAALGYAHSDGKHYALAPQILELGYSYLSSLSLTEALQPFLAGVTETLKESSSAAVLDGADVTYVARSAARHRVIAVNLAIGARLPAHATSMGQVLLAHLEPQRLQHFLRTTPLERYTDNTLTDPADLAARLDRVRAQGWALCDGELEIGLRSVAVPVRGRDGRVTLAINVSTQASRASVEALQRDYLSVLQDAAAAFEKTLHL